MADQKISALTEVTAPAASDMVPIVNGGVTKKVQIQNLAKLGNVALGARAYHNVNQSIASGSYVSLAFNSERFDTDTIHDNTTNNGRLTCKTAGLYLISGCIEWAANATGIRGMNFRVNGTTIILQHYIAAAGGGAATVLSAATLYVLAVNDYVELQAVQTSGSGLNVVADPNSSPEFMMTRIGA